VKDLQKCGDISEVVPQEISEEEYYILKQRYIDNDTKGIESLIGYVGSACSYGGAWWNGYAKFNPKKNENHIKEAFNGLKKHINGFLNFSETKFFNNSYLNIEEIIKEQGYKPQDVVIYCDPPYASTKKYESDFNHNEFWEWCREMSKKGYKVYISEYIAPSDFRCIWKKEKKDGMGTTTTGNRQKTKIEKLFKYKV
jgi:DNA adenine methylase